MNPKGHAIEPRVRSFSVSRGRPTPTDVLLTLVIEHPHLSWFDQTGFGYRHADRAIAAYCLRTILGLSLPEIATAIGARSHAGVHANLRRLVCDAQKLAVATAVADKVAASLGAES